MKIDIVFFKACLQKQKYKDKSVNSYITCMQQFYIYFEKYGAEVVTIELIEKHVNWLIKEKEISTSYQKLILISIQKYYDLVLNQKLDLNTIYPKNHETP